MNGMPEINVLPVHELELKVIGKKIKFIPFTVEQERNLLMSLESEDLNDLLNNYINIMKSCIKEEIDFDNLSTVDFLTMIIWLRSKSKGEVLELQNPKCKNSDCGKAYEQSFLIEDTISYKNEGSVKDVIKISDDLSLQLKPLNYKFLYDMDKLKNEVDLYIHTAAYSISSVMYKEKIYNVNDINDLKQKIVSKLTLKNLSDIFMKCKEFVTIEMIINYVCPFCKHTETINEKKFLKLLK